MDPAIQADPYPAYARLRAGPPVQEMDGGIWAVARHEDIERVLRDPATFSSDLGIRVPVMSIVMMDAPDHTRLRRTVNRAFTPRNIKHLEPQIASVAHALLDAAGPRPDFVQAYANPLSVTVICTMLGVPLDQRDLLNRYARDALLASFAATGLGSPALLAEAKAGLHRLMVILDAAIAGQAATEDSIIGTLLADEAAGVLDREELRNLCALLLIGGHETTANLIASGAHILAGSPELWRRLWDEPALVPRFVEELVRLRPPLQRIARRTTRPVQFGTVTVPEGARLMLFPGSANRDATLWPGADAIDLERDGRGHLGFGAGIHACPGAALARMEARIAFEVLLDRMGAIALDPERRALPAAGYAAGNLGWNTLPLLLTPAGDAPMPSPDPLDRVKAIVADCLALDPAEIGPGTCAQTTPEWDSLAHLMIIDKIQTGFGITLPRLAAYTVQDVQELAALVGSVVSKAGQAKAGA